MTDRPDILCIGAMLWDVIGRAPRRMAPGADVPGRIRHLPGGVALNVAVALARRGLAPAVLSAVGRDPEGCALVAEAQRLGVLTGWLSRETGLPTDCYMGIEDSEGLIAAIADAHSLERAGGAILAPLSGDLAGWTAPVVLDGNLTEDLLSAIARDPRLAGADLRIVPAHCLPCAALFKAVFSLQVAARLIRHVAIPHEFEARTILRSKVGEKASGGPSVPAPRDQADAAPEGKV